MSHRLSGAAAGAGPATEIADGAVMLGDVDASAGTMTVGDVVQRSGAQLFLDDGTAGNPPIAFTGDPDAGLHYSSGVQLGAGGVSSFGAGGGLSRNNLILRFLSALECNSEATKTNTYAMGATEFLVPVDSTSGAFNVTLPPVVSNKLVVLKKIAGGSNVTILPNSGETIDGAASVVLSSGWNHCRWLWCDGTDWHTIAEV